MMNCLLPFRKASSLVVSDRIIISDIHHLVSVSRDGQIEWARDFAKTRSDTLILPTGELVAIEEDGFKLVVRSRSTGEPLLSLPVDTWAYAVPAVTKNCFIYTSDSNDLIAISTTEDILWKVQTDGFIRHQPLIVHHQVLVSHRGGLTAYSLTEGKRLWQISLAVGNAMTPPIRVDSHRVIVGYPDGIFRVDIQTQEVSPWLAPSDCRFLSNSPLVFTYLPAYGLILTTTAGVEGKKAVVSVTESGEVLWQYPISKIPVAISVGTAGQVYIAQSPTLDEWDKYKDFCEFSCFLLGLSATGEELWKWESPAPITSGLVVADDVVYGVCDGNLVRISLVQEYPG
ncbi:outer membrane protein assembly factor BamB family protein [Coleofasciculus sp.]|uniref:outer membrane protein assembly factor BamB family protein n=1 Tax=Coleofasciculus sp. TaxID=3100458 RepID=UPI003A1FC6F6